MATTVELLVNSMLRGFEKVQQEPANSGMETSGQRE